MTYKNTRELFWHRVANLYKMYNKTDDPDFSVYLSGTHDFSNSIYLNARICVASKERIVLWLCLIVKTRSRKSEAKKGHKGH